MKERPILFNAQSEFRYVWNVINARRGWDVNPWVWVIEFKRVHP